MAITQLIFKRQKNYVDTIEIDVVITEGATASARITKNPVESGVDMNDHIIIDPMVFTMQGVVSNTPVKLFSQASVLVSAITADKSRSQTAWEDLLKLHSSKTPFTLIQGLKSYDNVVLLTLTENQDKDTSNILSFTATFQEVIYVGVDAPPIVSYSDQNVSDKASPSVSGGLKQVG